MGCESVLIHVDIDRNRRIQYDNLLIESQKRLAEH